MMNGDRARGWKNDDLTQKAIQCIIEVHRKLGPGFLESVYRNALLVEMRRQGLMVTSEKEIVVLYQGVEVGRHRIDLLVEDRLIVELKAVEDLSRAHYAQTRSYLKAASLRVAILVNFAKPMADYRRVEPS